MAKDTFVLFGAAVVVLALLVSPSSGHNKSHGGHHKYWTTNSTTNVYNTNVDINLAGAFSKVFAFGDSGTDSGNARLTGNLQGFVGAWLQTVEGILAARSGGASVGSSSAGGGASGSVGSGLGSGSGSGSASLQGSGNGLTNGKLVIDHLCDALGIPPVPPYQNHSANFSNGANFALAGSTTLPGSFFLHNNLLSLMWKTIPQSFGLQLQWFNNFLQNFANGATKPDMENSLFWLGGVGANDFARIHKVATFSSNWLSQQAVDQVAKLVQGLVNQGAKYLVVQGLPPMGCLPLDLMLSPITERDQYGCAARINKAVMNHNELLQQKLGQLQKTFPHCVFVYADFWKAYMKVLSGVHQFGFVEPFKACCGFGGGNFNFNLQHLCGSPRASVCANAAKHMVWDGVHLTASMHQAIAKLFIHGGCTHPSFGQLVKIKKGLMHR